MNGKDIYELLAKQNIRLFNLSLDNDTMTFIHTNKTVEEWRSDVKGLYRNLKLLTTKMVALMTKSLICS